MRKFRLYRLITVILSIFFICIPYKQAIVFQPNNRNADIAYIPTNEETKFQIRYTHSIHLSDVVESIQVTTGKTIQQYELMYEDIAIGMPSNAEAGETFRA